jgi:hypothetical protein
LTSAIKSFALLCKAGETAGSACVLWCGTAVIITTKAIANQNVIFRIKTSPSGS